MPSLVFDKCCGCINLKTGCFIIGYLNLINALINIVIAFFAIAGGAVVMQDDDHEGMHEVGSFVLVVACIAFVALLLHLIFTIVLLVGLHKNKPGHLKAYLIYSMIFLVIVIINFIVGCSNSNCTVGEIIQHLITILLGIYLLLVIRSQYYHMRDPSRGPAIHNA